jgi:glycosyltransferase involved in cell wall biosynthesis
MVVPNEIEHDNRVRKEALAAHAAGYRVTMLYVKVGGGREPVRGEFSGVETIGVRLRYRLKNRRQVRSAALAGWLPLWRYWTVDTLDDAAQAVEAREARAPTRGGYAMALAKLARAVFRFRAHFFRSHRRRQLKRPAPRSANWRRYLNEVADMDAVVTPWILRLKPDLIHINDVYVLSAAVNAQAVLAKRGQPVPMVYDAHEYVAEYPRWSVKAQAAYIALERDLAPKFDAVVTVSEPIADAMEEDLRLPRRPVVVHNAPDPEAAEPCPNDSIREAAGVGPGVPLIVYSGVIQHQRNVPGVIKALPLLPEVHLAVICVPSTSVPLAVALREVAHSLGVADRVHLVEPVAPTQIASFMSSADVGVDPMDRNWGQHAVCLPNKLFDYLHAGLAVAVSNNECERAFVAADNLGTIFDPGSTEEIAAAIRQALERRDEFVASARAAGVVERYAWKAQVARLIRLYQELLPADQPTNSEEPGGLLNSGKREDLRT